jgi:hypothetical protein
LLAHIYSQDADGVTITARIAGLAFNTTHGFHIHQFGDLSSLDGLSLGSHYNPYNYSHNLPPQQRQYGDLGNICTFSPAGIAYYNYFDNVIRVNQSINIIGRGVVIHAIRDDGSTNYGPRIGMCVIGIANVLYTSTYIFDNACCSAPVCNTPVILAHSETGTGGSSSGYDYTTTSVSSSTSLSSGSLTPSNSNLSKTTVIVVSILVPLVVIIIFVAVVVLYLGHKRRMQDDKFKPFLDADERF